MPAFKQNQILATNIYSWPEIGGTHTRQQDLRAVNPMFRSGDACYQNNCQRCVVTYEARRRGYDVHAKPYLFQRLDTLPFDDEENGWPSVFENSVLEYCGAEAVSYTHLQTEYDRKKQELEGRWNSDTRKLRTQADNDKEAMKRKAEGIDVYKRQSLKSVE